MPFKYWQRFWKSQQGCGKHHLAEIMEVLAEGPDGPGWSVNHGNKDMGDVAVFLEMQRWAMRQVFNSYYCSDTGC